MSGEPIREYPCPNIRSELTFIVLARQDSHVPPESHFCDDRERYPMIGDVNLFFKGSSDDDDYEVEAEVMIAGVVTQTE